jgi:hypothetical protein
MKICEQCDNTVPDGSGVVAAFLEEVSVVFCDIYHFNVWADGQTDWWGGRQDATVVLTTDQAKPPRSDPD